MSLISSVFDITRLPDVLCKERRHCDGVLSDQGISLSRLKSLHLASHVMIGEVVMDFHVAIKVSDMD